MFSPPRASLHTLPQPSCHTARSRIWFFRRAELFCSKPALVTSVSVSKRLQFFVLREVEVHPTYDVDHWSRTLARLCKFKFKLIPSDYLQGTESTVSLAFGFSEQLLNPLLIKL